MQIRVQCPACRASFEVPGELAGRDGECSRCQKIFKVVPLSGEVDPAVLTGSNSNATLEMPAYDEDDNAASDTDEFDIPDLPEMQAQKPTSQKPVASDPGVPELDIPELDLSASRNDTPERQKSSTTLPKRAATVEAVSDETLQPEIDDDGSLFGDDIPELEDVREPVSRYASEDEVDPDAGGSYSLSGSDTTPGKAKSRQPRRRKPQRKSTSAKGDGSKVSSGSIRVGNPSAHDSDADDVQLFDDVLHDEDDDESSSQILLRRSGTFSGPGGSRSSGSIAANGSAGREASKRSKRAAPATDDAVDSGEETQQQPVLKRRASAGRTSAAAAENSAETRPLAGKKSRRSSQTSPRQLAMIAGGGAVLVDVRAGSGEPDIAGRYAHRHFEFSVRSRAGPESRFGHHSDWRDKLQRGSGQPNQNSSRSTSTDRHSRHGWR
jgi:hypothetical protein